MASALGTNGIFLAVAVTSDGDTPGEHDWVTIFESHTESTTIRSNDVRVTWDHRVAPAEVMDLHVRCTTAQKYDEDACAIANIRGFEDTPGGWDPVAWNGPREHGFGVYAKEMPLVVGDGNYGPRITADGDDNPFLGVERDLAGGAVQLRGPLVTLPTFTQTAPLSASIRWIRTTDAVSPDQSFEVGVLFVPSDLSEGSQWLVTIPGSTSTSDWQTQESGPLPTSLSGKVGHFVIEPADFSLGPIQAVGLDSLTFYLGGQPVDVPLTPCTRQIVTFGDIEADGCFSHPQPTTWEATGAVRMNGIDLSTEGTITLDAAGPSLSVDGRVEASVGEGDDRFTLLTAGGLEWDLSAELTLALPENRFHLKGFPITGEATVRWSGGKAEIALEVGLPALMGGVTAGAGVSASVEDGLQFDSLSIKVAEAKLGPASS